MWFDFGVFEDGVGGADRHVPRDLGEYVFEADVEAADGDDEAYEDVF